MKFWDIDFESTFALNELAQRNCTDEDIIPKEGEAQTEYGFFKLDERSSAVGDISSRFKCIDEPFENYGDYVSDRTNNLMIFYELCDTEKRSTCRSD